MDDPKVDKQLRQLSAIPNEFRQLAEYGWNELRPALEKQARRNGADPHLAAQIASRLARLVVSQMYGDITRARTTVTIPS